MDENTRIMDMEITDEFFMVTEDERANTVAHSLQNLGEGGVVLVRQPSNEVVGYITEKEIVNSVATGFNPSDSTASQMMSTDFMEVMGDEILGNVLPLISEQYPNAPKMIIRMPLQGWVVMTNHTNLPHPMNGGPRVLQCHLWAIPKML